MKSNHIIVIDDDDDDCELFKHTCNHLKITNEIIIFNNSNEAFGYLMSMDKQPLFIICDINMPFVNGLELRQKINETENLILKAVPFLFWSTSGTEASVNEAYSLNIQGYFRKPDDLQEMREMLSVIMKYWNYSQHPSN